MTENHLWNKSKNLNIQTGPEITGGFDIGFDDKIPEPLRDRLMHFVYWVEDHFELPVTLWVDFKYCRYLMGHQKRVDYRFYWADFPRPLFENPDDIPVIELPVNRPMEELLPSFITAISRYFLWLTDTQSEAVETAQILQAYLRTYYKLTVTVPADAAGGLYPQVPASRDFSKISPENAIAAAAVYTADGMTTYCYDGLSEGLYHFAATRTGYNSVCQMLNFTGSLHFDMDFHKLAGNGYEAGFVMRYTPEFTKSCLPSGKDTWGPQYAKLFSTPQFMAGRPGRHQQTTNEELMAFIQKLGAENRYMHIFSLGTSPKYGYDMPLVLFTREKVDGMTLAQAAAVIRSNRKPTIQHIAQCHSTEPVSCEGALATMVSLCGDFGKILDAVDVYIIPRVNPDGAYEVTRRSPTSGEDMNRDYLYMHSQELRMLVAAYNLFKPEVAIDGHEKWHRYHIPGDDICTDMEVQTGAGSLNHPAAMTELTMKMARSVMENARKLGLRTNFYGKLASAAGGAAGSSYFGTRNSLSFLVETPGQVNQGMEAMERRVLAQYVFASGIMDYTAQNAVQIMETVHSSRAYMRRTGPVYDENNVIVLEHGATVTGLWPVPLIHVPTGTITDPKHTEEYTEHTEALRTRPRATAYVIPAGIKQEQELLRVAENHDLVYYRLPAGSTAALKQYLQNADGVTLMPEREVCFEQGAYVFPNVVDSTVLGVIMEPDFNLSTPDRKMTLLRMGIITPDADGALPLYRYCYDLTDGKIQ